MNENYNYTIEIKKYTAENGARRFEISSPDAELEACQTIEDLIVSIIHISCMSEIPAKSVLKAIKQVFKSCEVEEVENKDYLTK